MRPESSPNPLDPSGITLASARAKEKGATGVNPVTSIRPLMRRSAGFASSTRCFGDALGWLVSSKPTERARRRRYAGWLSLPQLCNSQPIRLRAVLYALLAAGEGLGDCADGHALAGELVELLDFVLTPGLAVAFEFFSA